MPRKPNKINIAFIRRLTACDYSVKIYMRDHARGDSSRTTALRGDDMHKLKSLRTNGSLAAIVLIAVATAIAAMVLFMRAPVFSYAQTSDGVMPVDGTEIAVEHPENRLLDEARSKAAKQPVMFDMPTEWTYGDAPEIGVPRVEHESDAGELGGELNITLTLDY